MTIEEQIATELIERTKRNESPYYAGQIEGDGRAVSYLILECYAERRTPQLIN